MVLITVPHTDASDFLGVCLIRFFLGFEFEIEYHDEVDTFG